MTEGRGDTGTRGIIVDGKSYHFDAGENGGLAIEGLPAASPLPAELAKDSYTLEAKRDPLGENVFFLAISLIIMGVGFLKPNIST
ncbi:hypothetical protein, partial [Mesorhizobium japonicum]|uniref:hypothetical protein n=1 Tax=Mesorhizobium japonicum TaxID=2066070 RepID=UPI003B5BFEB8